MANYRETMETMTDFIFLGSKITTDGDSSHEIKRRSPLGRKATTNLDNILKSKDITLPTKVCIVQLSHLYMTTGKIIAWTRKTFAGKVMFQFLNMLVIAFLPRSNYPLISCSSHHLKCF